jgi:hypothetical protein
MNAQDFIAKKLQELKRPLGSPKFNGQDLENEIVRLILSKKFRKYSMTDEEIEKVKKAVHICVSENKPIETVFSFGGYKLWRLGEAPEADFSELFALMYFSKWLKPICEIYKPGVHLDCFSDDAFLPIINNIPESETAKYRKSFNDLVLFLKEYVPQNLDITLTRVFDQYESKADFLADFDKCKKELSKNLAGKLPELTERRKATVELNVKPTPEQLKDELWREKILLDHDALMAVSRRRPYVKMPDKINFIIGDDGRNGRMTTGSTKNSIMKFWVGVGVLKPKGDTYEMTILSPKQLEKLDFSFEPVALKGLYGKNFDKIRIEKYGES